MQSTSSDAATSIWHATAPAPAHPPLAGDAEADVCVVGAGIGGLSTAYLLAREGKRVLVIDAASVGAGETGRTTAHFFPPDEWYTGLEGSVGPAHAAMVADSFAGAIAAVESIVAQERLDCGFERLDGYLYALPGNTLRDFERERDAAQRAGVPVELLDRVPQAPFDTGPCIRFPDQAQFHPLRYLHGLARAIGQRGGSIHGATRALELASSGQRHVVTTEHGKISAGAVVVATNTPFNHRALMHATQSAYATYVVGIAVPAGSVPRVLMWDTGDPYYYIRVASSGAPEGCDVLVVGGADHRVGQDQHPEHRYHALERWVRERYPMAGELLYRWSGKVIEPADGAPYLGRDPLHEKDVYIITGDSGNGMTHCTIGAMLVTDLIMGRENPWAALYDPARITEGAGVPERRRGSA